MVEKHAFWTHLFTEQHAALRGFFRRRMGATWEADDLPQEVYLRILRTESASEQTIANPEAYLFTVAANLVKERAAQRQRAGVRLDIEDYLHQESITSDPSVEESYERNLREKRLADMIDRLPPKCKAVMLMQYREDMSYEEISRRLGISTHMVKKTVVKALALCRRGLAQYR